MSLIIGYDIGTTSAKAVVTDQAGRVLAHYSKKHKTIVNHAGWQEQSFTVWETEFADCIAHFAKKDIDLKEVKAIGFTGLLPAFCAIDSEGKPVFPAILHTDTRAENELKEINMILDHPISHAFMLPKILWVKNHQPELFSKIYKIMSVHNYFAYFLTGKVTMDYDTSYMIGGVVDEENLSWNKTSLKKVGLSEKILPELKPANAVIGKITEEKASEYGLSKDLQVITGVGDTFASLLGGGAQKEKQVMVYLGTSATNLYTEKSPKYYMNQFHYGPGKAQFVGRILSYGETLNSWIDRFDEKDFEKYEQKIVNIEPGANELWYFPHFKMQMESDFWKLDSENMLGIRPDHTIFDIYRAVLEGVAFNIKENINQINGEVRQINIFGGGAKSKEFIKIIASVLNHNITFNSKSSTAFGIAFLAGLATGIVDSYERLIDTWFSDSLVIEPVESWVNCYQLLGEQRKVIEENLKTVHKRKVNEENR